MSVTITPPTKRETIAEDRLGQNGKIGFYLDGDQVVFTCDIPSDPDDDDDFHAELVFDAMEFAGACHSLEGCGQSIITNHRGSLRIELQDRGLLNRETINISITTGTRMEYIQTRFHLEDLTNT